MVFDFLANEHFIEMWALHSVNKITASWSQTQSHIWTVLVSLILCSIVRYYNSKNYINIMKFSYDFLPLRPHECLQGCMNNNYPLTPNFMK